MLARRDLDRRYLARQYSMPMDVVGVRRFFDPRRPIHRKVAGHANGNWKTPALVGVEHESARLADTLPQHTRPPEIATSIARSHFQLQGFKSRVEPPSR